MYLFVYWYAIKNVPKLKEMFEQEKKKYGKIEFATRFIQSIDNVSKLTNLPKQYADCIKKNKNIILKTINLKQKLTNNKNKNVTL